MDGWSDRETDREIDEIPLSQEQFFISFPALLKLFFVASRWVSVRKWGQS